jgi:hypothetical protein
LVLVLVLALGAALAFLSLEVIGIPLVLVALALIVYIGRKSGDLALPLMGFGIGFAASVGFFAVRTSGIFSGETGAVGMAWFAAHFLFGLGVVGTGSWLLQRRATSTGA